MSTQFILITGAVILACGCAGLLMVRLDNPRLLGLGWLGGALAAGGSGAILLLLNSQQIPLVFILLPDLLILTSLVLLHLAVREVVGLRGIPPFAVLLLTLQAAADLLGIYGNSSSLRITVVGLLIAVQSANTVLLLFRRSVPATRSPARFIMVVLVGFTTWNIVRSIATGTGLLANRTLAGHSLASQVQAFTLVLFLAVALGLTLGFFWMSTTLLTAQLDELASTDPLTGALNRRAFVARLEAELDRSERFNDSFALLMLDLDHFKKVNDRHGHTAGDEVLCAAVQNIQDAVRGIDTVGRWGGEEFVILLPHANLAAAHIVAERIRANIRRPAPLSDRSKHIPVTASIGLSVRHRDDCKEDVISRADLALYRAKSAGRNCVAGDQ